MRTIRLGRTGLMATTPAFGALPIQRDDMETAIRILRRALEGGINFYDTARVYSDSEEKLGVAFANDRSRVILATKSPSTTREGVLRDIETSLTRLQTDHVDLLQLHNPDRLPDPDDRDGAYAGLVEAQRQGMADHIGVTLHRPDLAIAAVESGLYETLQFPFSYLSTDADIALVGRCAEADMGFIAMKGLSGGLITSARTAVAFLNQHETVVPIWGIQHLHELEEFLALSSDPPQMDEAMIETIARDRVALSGSFCRACGYCMPCPVGIPINIVARVQFLLERSPYPQWITREMQSRISAVDNCRDCGLCRARCPYQLDIPTLIRDQNKKYRAFVAKHADEVV